MSSKNNWKLNLVRVLRIWYDLQSYDTQLVSRFSLPSWSIVNICFIWPYTTIYIYSCFRNTNDDDNTREMYEKGLTSNSLYIHRYLGILLIIYTIYYVHLLSTFEYKMCKSYSYFPSKHQNLSTYRIVSLSHLPRRMNWLNWNNEGIILLTWRRF